MLFYLHHVKLSYLPHVKLWSLRGKNLGLLFEFFFHNIILYAHKFIVVFEKRWFEKKSAFLTHLNVRRTSYEISLSCYCMSYTVRRTSYSVRRIVYGVLRTEYNIAVYSLLCTLDIMGTLNTAQVQCTVYSVYQVYTLMYNVQWTTI